MKKVGLVLATLLVLALVMGSVGCDGGQETPIPSPKPSDVSTPTSVPTPSPSPTPTPTPANETYFPGCAPGTLGLTIAPNGKTAYTCFELDDSLLEIDLPTFTVKASIDVSAAGNMLGSTAMTLSLDGEKLYVSNFLAKNVMVVSTKDRQVSKVLPIQPLYATAISISSDGSKVYVPSVDGGLYIINELDDSYQRVFIPDVCFGPVAPSSSKQNLLYTVGTLISPSGYFQRSFFTFNLSTNMVERSSSLPEKILPPLGDVRRLVLNSSETLAYFRGFELTGEDKGVSTFNVLSLDSFQILASVPVENGVTDFAINEERGKIYIIGIWAGGGAPNKLNINEWDILTNKIVRQIPVSPSSDQRAIAIDPTDANYLYMTEGDFNLLRKVDISTGKEIASVRFNKQGIQPYEVIRGDNNVGYILCQSLPTVYKLDLGSGQMIGRIELPFQPGGGGFYNGKLYFGDGGREIYAINPTDGSIIERYHNDFDIQSLSYNFFGSRMATIDYETVMIGSRLLIFDAGNMTLLKSIELPHEPYGDKVIVSPDGSKLYVARGPCWGGTTVITVFDSSTLEVINAIEIPAAELRRGATSFTEGDFDEAERILYLTGFESVYRIDMDTDKLVGTLDLIDLCEAQGICGWTPTGLCGVALSASKDKLFIVSGDAHSMYTYDLAKSSWSTKITNLGGYFITDAVSSPDRRYLYTVNSRTDSITVVDLVSGDVVRVIRL